MSGSDALSMPRQEAEMLSVYGDGLPHPRDVSEQVIDWPTAVWGLAGCGSYAFDLLSEGRWYL